MREMRWMEEFNAMAQSKSGRRKGRAALQRVLPERAGLPLVKMAQRSYAATVMRETRLHKDNVKDVQ